MNEQEKPYRPIKLDGVNLYPDNSAVTRFMREKLTGSNVSTDGGIKFNDPLKNYTPIPQVPNIGNLPGEEDATLEVQFGVGLGMAGLDIGQVIAWVEESQPASLEVDEKVQISDELINQLLEELEAEYPGRLKEVLAETEEIIQQVNAEEEYFRQKLKEN